jgi:hypothetical protein
MLDQSNLSVQRCRLIFLGRMQCWWLFGFGKDYTYILKMTRMPSKRVLISPEQAQYNHTNNK